MSTITPLVKKVGRPKGGIPWNKGIKSPYVAWNKGRTMSELSKEKNRLAHIGKKASAETRYKMSLVNKGKKPLYFVNTGRTHFKHETVAGELNPNWKGGISSEHDKLRHSREIRLWRKACMERDSFTCQKTGRTGGNLVVHHINNFSDFPELRTSIENGITLSRESHIEFHKKYGKKNNSRLQLDEYLNIKLI